MEQNEVIDEITGIGSVLPLTGYEEGIGYSIVVSLHLD